MNEEDTRQALYRALEDDPSDKLVIQALADWYEEHDQPDAAECLRWTVEQRKYPFRYQKEGKLKVACDLWHEDWFWWARVRRGADWGHPRTCQLPSKIWQRLRHSFNYNPWVFKEYRTIREAYEALIDIWAAKDRTTEEKKHA